jgi:hypothetical protein
MDASGRAVIASIALARTGHHFDDSRRYIDALDVAPEALAMVYKLNARRGVRGLPVLVTAPARLPMDAARDAAETRRNP